MPCLSQILKKDQKNIYMACALLSKRAAANKLSNLLPPPLLYDTPMALVVGGESPSTTSAQLEAVLMHPAPPTWLQRAPPPQAPGDLFVRPLLYSTASQVYTACLLCPDCSCLGSGPSLPLTPHQLPKAYDRRQPGDVSRPALQS